MTSRVALVKRLSGLNWAELGTCGATISLAITLAPQLVLSSCADACAASILTILSAIAQAQVKCDYE